MEISKIQDKSLNLDVQGQGCWDDCYIARHWEDKASSTTAGCVYYSDQYTSQGGIFN